MLAYYERSGKPPATSVELAESIGTNPVVVRRVLAELGAAGLVESRRGRGGGSVLARDARRITLRDAYEAVTSAGENLLGRHAGELGPSCQVAPVIAEYLDELFREAEEALVRRLSEVTVDEMSRAIVDRLQSRPARRAARRS
jgi:DNA-binding IscR family transcriptional regulator